MKIACQTPAVLAACILMLGSAQAQDIEVLTPIAPEIEAGADPVNFVSRCGGLYLSLFEWLGPSRLGAANSENIRNSVGMIIRLEAETTYADQGEDAALEAAEADIRNQANEYIKYYSALYVDRPEAMTSDPLLASDNASCQMVLGGIGQ